MATQAIRFIGPPGQTITLDVFTLSSDTAEQSGLTCTEATNRKGLYTTANFTDTLAGRHYVVKKIGGTAIGSDFVLMSNADGTYDSEGVSPEVLKIQRAASAVTAGAAQERYIENAGGTKLQTIYEVHEGDKA